MDSPSLLPPFDRLALHPFSFYPAILGFEHNEWLLREATWSEILVVNRKTNEELWIPRQYVGEISPIEDPVVLVGLTRELEYKSGMLVPFKRRLLKMPAAAGYGAGSQGLSGPAPPHGMAFRMDSADKRVFRLIVTAMGSFVLFCVLVVGVSQIGRIRQRRTSFTARDSSFEALTAHDGRLAVVTKLGNPNLDRFKEVGTLQYEALSYTDRRYTVILMGPDIPTVLYIGTVDDNWKPMHAAVLRSGGTTEDLLRTVERF
ncbi:MAG: hypothetical protein ABSC23_15150 [Bryobacteraceae bacterium]|jgi:hypothetical protein